MSNSQQSRNSSSSCSIFRRLLCGGGGLPTHPSTDDDEPSIKYLPTIDPVPVPVPGGIVAKLMGLDSFPCAASSTTLIMRKSRSVGSLVDITKVHIPHRRSVSFRELVTTTSSFVLQHGQSVADMDRRLTPIQENCSNNFNNNKKGHSHTQRVHSKRKQPVVVSQRRTSSSVTRKTTSSNQPALDSTRKKKLPCIINYTTTTTTAISKKKKLVSINYDDGFPQQQKMKNKHYNHPLPNKNKRKSTLLLLKQQQQQQRSSSGDDDHVFGSIKVLLADVCRLTMFDIQGPPAAAATSDQLDMIQLEVDITCYDISQRILQFLVFELLLDLST